jgi:VWFA-related protein
LAQSANTTNGLGPTLKRTSPVAKKRAGSENDKKPAKETALDEADVVRVETSLVTCDVLVLDKQGKAVGGLSQSDFIVTEDDKRQEIGSFSLGDDTTIPRSIVLIMDYSASMVPYIQMSVEAAKVLVDKLGPKDTMAIVTDDLALLADFTGDKAELKDKLESLKEKAKEHPTKLSFGSGHSLQFSALLATLREMFDDEDVRPIIIFQTDGDELEMMQPAPGSVRARVAWPFSLKDVYAAAEKSRATIYSVIPGFRLAGLSADQQMKQFGLLVRQTPIAEALAKGGQRFEIGPGVAMREIESRTREQFAVAGVAELTGGLTVFLEDPAQAAGIYSSILSDINRRYVITYYPTNKEHDGKRRTVRIEVLEHPEYTVWGRKSYYAPG